MVQGFAFSFGIQDDEGVLHGSHVQGNDKDDLQLVRTEAFRFLPGSVNQLFGIIQRVQRWVSSTTGDRDTELNLVTGADKQLLEYFGRLFRLGIADPKKVSSALASLLTETVHGKCKIKNAIGTFSRGDKARQGEVIAAIEQERPIYEYCVKNINNPQCLDQLDTVAYVDGQLYANDSVHLAKIYGPFQLRLALFGASHSDDILYTYLNAHPQLKQSFARGMDSLRVYPVPPHHVCVKTFLDKQAPQFVDLLGTVLADRMNEKEEKKIFGHVQVKV